MFARIRNRRRALRPVRFVPVAQAFTPQVEVKMTRDVTGWVDREDKARYHLRAGQVYLLDEDTAAEFIVKGYAQGRLPRDVSGDEAAEWRAQSNTISIGDNDG